MAAVRNSIEIVQIPGVRPMCELLGRIDGPAETRFSVAARQCDAQRAMGQAAMARPSPISAAFVRVPMGARRHWLLAMCGVQSRAPARPPSLRRAALRRRTTSRPKCGRIPAPDLHGSDMRDRPGSTGPRPEFAHSGPDLGRSRPSLGRSRRNAEQCSLSSARRAGRLRVIGRVRAPMWTILPCSIAAAAASSHHT